jgi:DeoR family transcriptional regulator of aga operon
MLNEERRQKIQEILTLKKRILVKEVSRDILSRVHGGAILKESTVPDIALTEKEHIHPQEKQKIAQKAAELIERGDVIILDSGSTTTQIARLVKFKKDLKIITNAVNIALELAASDNEVILTGGFLREKSFSLVGSIAEEALRTMTVDKLFLGVDGIHFQYGLTTPNLMEGRVNRLMMKIAHEVIVVADSSKFGADSSKFGKRSMSVIAGVEEADTIITDKKINNEDFNRLRELGVEAILV